MKKIAHSINSLSFSPCPTEHSRSMGRLRGAFLLSAFFFLLSTSFSQEQFNVHYADEYGPAAQNVFVLADTGYATVGGNS